MSHSGLPITQTAVIYGLAAAFLLWRFSRPQKISVTRLWLSPVLLLAVSITSIYASQQFAPAAPLLLAVALIGGAMLGAPLGLLRGYHTTVMLTAKPGVMQLGASWIVAGIWIGAFVIRAGLRLYFGSSPLGSVVGDALLTFAITLYVTSYIAIYRKYMDELTQVANA